MARVIICDRCSTIIYKEWDSHTIKISKTTGAPSRRDETNPYFHLCENCFSDFIEKFMNVKNEESDG